MILYDLFFLKNIFLKQNFLRIIVNTDYHTWSFSYLECDHCGGKWRLTKQKDCEHTLCGACDKMCLECPVCSNGKISFIFWIVYY